MVTHGRSEPRKAATRRADPYEPLFRPDPPIVDGETYRESLRGRGLNVRLFGERITEPVDHPIVRPSVNAVAATYDLAVKNPSLATAHSSLSNRRVNRFLQIAESVEDVVAQNDMQRELGRNAVGYLTESMHGAGSPQAQRVQIQRSMKIDEKKRLARRLAGVRETPQPVNRMRKEE